MINNVIWKDTIFSGTEDYLEYRISKNVVTPIYYGKAFRSPSSGRYEINISDKARSFLKPHISSSAWTTVDGVYETKDFAATFAIQDLANSAVSLEQFYLQYTTAEDFIGGAKITARPINGHIDPRMKMMWAKWDYMTRNVPVDKGYKYFDINIVSGSLDYEFSGGTNTVVFEATGPDYTITTDDEWLHITGGDGTYEITADINTGETRTGYICAQWYNAQFQLEEKCFEVRQKQDYASMYFTLEALSAGTLSLDSTYSSSTVTFYYKKNNESWVGIPFTESIDITVDSGDLIKMKANANSYYTPNPYGAGSGFKITPHFNCDAYGNILSLIYGDSFRNYIVLPSKGTYAFYELFKNSDIVSAKNVIMPANVRDACYWGMFQGCTSLIDMPTLPATTISYACYNSMFQGCTSLVEVSELPAEIMRESCYAGMFQGCTSLTTAPALPATMLSGACYSSMFAGCTSLVNAPALPATTLANVCYAGMFENCTSLTNAPDLPATALKYRCYNDMFKNCTSLITAPIISAMTADTECCMSMFQGCTSLTATPVLLATTLATGCYKSMFEGCTALEIASDLLATALAPSCYQNMFSGCTALENAPALPATALTQYCYAAMFSDCTSLTAAPILSATTLADDCYWHMFENCTSLTTAPALPAVALAGSCYVSMFQGCTSLTTAPALPATALTSNCYYAMFRYCTSLETAPDLLAANVAAASYYNMFSGCSSLNYIRCLATRFDTWATNNWTAGVSSTGTFVKKSGASWSKGANGIPNGWTVQQE